MTILFLLRLWPVYGGGETVTICLANEMVKRGWEVHITYFKTNTRKDLPYIDNRIKTFQIEGTECNEFCMPDETAYKAQQEVIGYSLRNGINVIVSQWWEPNYLTRIKDETGAKLIHVMHTAFFAPVYDVTLKSWMKKCIQPIYEAYTMKRRIKMVEDYLPHVDKFVFLSPRFQLQYQKAAHNNNSRGLLSAIANPLPSQEATDEDILTRKEKLVLLVGRMEETPKKITHAIKAWAKIEEDSSLQEWRFEVVGQGRDLDRYKRMAARMNLKRISFEGFQDPVPYYRRARIFLMTSAFEGFSMTLIEAQKNGVVPIVMDSFLALHDIIVNGENGIITPNADISTFVSELYQLMKKPEQQEKLAKAGMKSCKKFNVENIVDQWEMLIRTIDRK